jgi:hypothetical protein
MKIKLSNSHFRNKFISAKASELWMVNLFMRMRKRIKITWLQATEAVVVAAEAELASCKWTECHFDDDENYNGRFQGEFSVAYMRTVWNICTNTKTFRASSCILTGRHYKFIIQGKIQNSTEFETSIPLCLSCWTSNLRWTAFIFHIPYISPSHI